MNGFKLALLVWIAVAGLVSVGTIGKPRKASTPSVAVASLILLAIEAALVVAA